MGAFRPVQRRTWFSISSWSARYGPLRSSTPCVAALPAHLLARAGLSTAPVVHGGQGTPSAPVRGQRSTAVASKNAIRRRARCLETRHRRRGHGACCRRRRRSGDRRGTRGSMFLLAEGYPEEKPTRGGSEQPELEIQFLRELGCCKSSFFFGSRCLSFLAHRVGEQLPVTAVCFSSLAPRQVSLGGNAVRSTDTPGHGAPPARRADPAVSAVWAPRKVDLGRLLGPQVTPGPNGGQIGGFWAP